MSVKGLVGVTHMYTSNDLLYEEESLKCGHGTTEGVLQRYRRGLEVHYIEHLKLNNVKLQMPMVSYYHHYTSTMHNVEGGGVTLS